MFDPSIIEKCGQYGSYPLSRKATMVVYDAIIRGKSENYVSEANLIGDEIWFITAYPLRNKEIENRVKSGRWVLKNEKN